MPKAKCGVEIGLHENIGPVRHRGSYSKNSIRKQPIWFSVKLKLSAEQFDGTFEIVHGGTYPPFTGKTGKVGDGR